jgi:outer membrane immunogenic protein
MKNSKLILSAAVAVSAMLGIGAASAADMAVKAMPYIASPPAFSWTGFYIGGNAGYGWSNANFTLASVGTRVPPFPQEDVDASANATPRILNTNPHGFIGGGQFGYNYQTNRLVWGIEADFSFADIKGSDTKNGTAAVVSAPLSLAHITAIGEQKLNYFGTVRGRLGFTPIDSVLLYATGGLAYGQVESNINTSDVGAPIITGPASGSASATRTGWTAGGGIETALAFAPRWSLKAEYLYYDLVARFIQIEG